MATTRTGASSSGHRVARADRSARGPVGAAAPGTSVSAVPRFRISGRRSTPRPATVALMAALAAGVLAPTAQARPSTPTEQFAFNVLYKNYAIGDTPKTTILDGTWHARCQVIKHARVPVATCRLSWDSDHAHWTASARLRGAVRIGPTPYRRFTWRFRVTSRCAGDSCRDVPPAHRVRHLIWRGTGFNTPA